MRRGARRLGRNIAWSPRLIVICAALLFVSGLLTAVSRLRRFEGGGLRTKHRPWHWAATRARNSALDRHCDLHFGEAWLSAWVASKSDLCAAADAPGGLPPSRLTCRSMTDAHMPAAAAPHVLCDAAQLLLDPKRLQPAPCPRHRPGYMCGGHTYHRYLPGAWGLRCEWPRRDLAAFPRDHLRDIMESVTAEPRLGLPQGTDVDATPTLLVTREAAEHANVFHALTDLLNAHLTLRALGWGGRPRRVLLLDSHPPGPLDGLWAAVAGGGGLPALAAPWNATPDGGEPRLLRAASLGNARLFETTAFVPPGYSSLLFAHLHEANSCPQPTPLFAGFREWMLAPLGLNQPRLQQRGVLKAVLVSRRAGAHGRPAPRRIANEPVLLAGLQAAAPAADVSLVDLAQLELLEQLRLVTAADILIGMHGAGLAWSLLMRPGAALLELWPAGGLWRCYEHTAEWAGLRYRRWEAGAAKEAAATTVDVAAVAALFAELVASLQRSTGA